MPEGKGVALVMSSRQWRTLWAPSPALRAVQTACSRLSTRLGTQAGLPLLRHARALEQTHEHRAPRTCTLSFFSRRLDAEWLGPEACRRSLQSGLRRLELSAGGAPRCHPGTGTDGGRRLRRCPHLNRARFLGQAPYEVASKSNLWSELANAIYAAPALDCLLKIPSGGHSLLNLFKETEPVFAN